ncbi:MULTISPECIES: hypothetical protein [Sphingobacterium]|uniref:Uncharacterized protein n=2 Tax=Sphingobacterium TaxID=28453 RepID=A0ABW5L439_9SPHI|nr:MULTISPECIES: hypothetical protein [Sphingobacterium]MBL1408312.1 hypothetical protein [Sphingobacterium faecale]
MYKFVSIFKTNVQTLTDKIHILEGLQSLKTPLIVSLDLEDEDRVLRVESNEHVVPQIVSKVDEYNFKCEELDSFLMGIPLRTMSLS